MLHTIFIKCYVDVMYFIFIFTSPFIPRSAVKMSVNQLIKNKKPNGDLSPCTIGIFRLIYLNQQGIRLTAGDGGPRTSCHTHSKA